MYNIFTLLIIKKKKSDRLTSDVVEEERGI